MKKFRYLFVCLLAVLTGLYFVSCGSDDDDEGGDPDSIVGTWVTHLAMSYYGYYEDYDSYIMFCGNGTFYEFELDSQGAFVEKMKYVYDKKTSKLSVTEGNLPPHTYEVVSLDATSMTIRDNNSGSRIATYKRVKSPYTASQLEKFYKED